MPQRRYICSFCARPFSRSEHKARHERSHTKEKPFNCDQCPSAFVRRDLLQRHLRTVHAKDKPSQNGTRRKSSTSVKEVKNTDSDGNNSISIDDSLLFKFNESNIISLLTLSKKFDSSISPSSTKISTLFLTWGTISNNALPIITSEDLLSLSTDSNLLYSILALGAMDANKIPESIHFINKSWAMILKQQQSGVPKCEIIQSLTILSYLYLHNHDQLKQYKELVPIEIIMDYLDKTICVLVKNGGGVIMFDYWRCYQILSNYSFHFNKSAPNLHSLVLAKYIPSSETPLNKVLENLSKSSPLTHLSTNHSCEVIICALSNELQSIKYNDQLNFYESKEFLHNAIIMLNKQFPQQSSSSTSLDNLIMISKRNLLLNCPLKFQDLITDYIFIPQSSHHWYLLQLTLKEFNFEYTPTSIQQIIDSTAPTFQIQQYLSSISIKDLNNNIGLTSLPLLFLGFIHSATPPLHSTTYPPFLKHLVLENHLILLSIFTNLTQEQYNNPIIQSIVYLIQEMGSTPPQRTPATTEPTCFSRLEKQWIIENIVHNLQTWCHTLNHSIDLSFLTKEVQSPLASQPSSPQYYTQSYTDTSATGPSWHIPPINTTQGEKIKLPPIWGASPKVLLPDLRSIN